MEAAIDRRKNWEERYRSGSTPWDTGITPPEVQAFWQQDRLPRRGLAIELGCGTATNAAYLAGLGLTVVGCDLSGVALRRGVERLSQRARERLPRVHLVQADVSALPLERAGACYVLDIGCLHAVPPASRPGYAAGVIANLAAGGYYQLYAFDRAPAADDDADDWRGLAEDEWQRLFTPALEAVEIVRAQPNPHPCRWYLLRKL